MPNPLNDNYSPSGLRFEDGDVLYRSDDGKGTRLYARLPGLAFAVQQYVS